uniref:Peptidase A2 domain-containing protein n=1 Tax=Mycena chlorophos TaxID=658473 RepID=A0ABQ0L210_MYCCL|nr:predicted protein [Mycena chlorophos]
MPDLRMPPPRSFGAPLRTSLDMPIPGSKEAPKTFKGKYYEADRFVRHMDSLFTKNRVSDERERCNFVLDYCSTNVQNVIRTMEYFRTPRWIGLRREILTMFDAERTQHKYQPSDVVKHAKETTKQPITNMSQWRRYNVKYNIVAGGLLAQKRLSEEHFQVYFWFGIPRDLRATLEARILHGRSLLDNSQYTVREINLAAEWCFRRTRAETMLIDAAEFGFDGFADDEDSDSSSSDSDTDSDRDRRRSKRKKKSRSSSKSRKSRESSKPKSTSGSASKGKAKFEGNEDEIAGMIKQLNGIKLDDPDYAPTYFKVLSMDSSGIARTCVKAPAEGQQSTLQRQNYPRRTSYPQTTPVGRPAESSTAHTSTISSAPTAPSAAATYPNSIPISDQECFGCKKAGHPIDHCDAVNELIQRGLLARNPESRRIQWASGAPLRRLQGESIVEAVERVTSKQQPSAGVMLTFVEPILGTQTAVENFYQSQARVREIQSESSDWESEHDRVYFDKATPDSDYDNTVYLSVPRTVQFQDRDHTVYEAERTIPSTRQARQSTFKDVYPPPRERAAAKVSSPPIAPAQRMTHPNTRGSAIQKNETAKPASTGSSGPAPQAKPAQPPPAKAPVRPPTPPLKSATRKIRPDPVDVIPDVAPFDARVPRSERDTEMPDAAPIRGHTAPLPRDPQDPAQRSAPTEHTKPENHAPRGGPIRQSAISQSVNRSEVTNRVLDTKLEVSLRELMEVSKDVRTELTDLIRPRNPKSKAVLMSASTLPRAVWSMDWPRTDGILIKVEMLAGDLPIVAIIDTGSQLNVVRGEIARQKIRRVVDMTCIIKMNDANGGSGQLRGLIRGAELECGGLRTRADLWVSEKAPFDLLLGRPWQRENKVSIDERREGTYLVFKDGISEQPRFEMLAAPAETEGELPSLHAHLVNSLNADPAPANANADHNFGFANTFVFTPEPLQPARQDAPSNAVIPEAESMQTDNESNGATPEESEHVKECSSTASTLPDSNAKVFSPDCTPENTAGELTTNKHAESASELVNGPSHRTQDASSNIHERDASRSAPRDDKGIHGVIQSTAVGCGLPILAPCWNARRAQESGMHTDDETKAFTSECANSLESEAASTSDPSPTRPEQINERRSLSERTVSWMFLRRTKAYRQKVFNENIETEAGLTGDEIEPAMRCGRLERERTKPDSSNGRLEKPSGRGSSNIPPSFRFPTLPSFSFNSTMSWLFNPAPFSLSLGFLFASMDSQPGGAPGGVVQPAVALNDVPPPVYTPDPTHHRRAGCGDGHAATTLQPRRARRP